MLYSKKYKKIVSDSYTISWCWLDSDLSHMTRSHSYTKNHIAMDVFCDHWVLMILDKDSYGRIGTGNKDEKKLFTSKTNAIFVPPFCLVKWYIAPGHLNWQAYSAKVELSTKQPKHPFRFNWSEAYRPKNIFEMQEIISSIKTWDDVELKEFGSEYYRMVAHRIKKYIDSHFNEEMTFTEISKILSITRDTLQRSFKQCYGISPAQYRSKLRVHHSMSCMLFGTSATNACFDSGFSDFSQFYRNFKKQTNESPSKYSDSSSYS